MKSNWSEQLNTTHWIAIAFAKSLKIKEKLFNNTLANDNTKMKNLR